MRYRTLLIGSAVLAVTAAAVLLYWRDRLVLARPLLTINFDHHDHGAVKCATCHHNFFDKTGRDSCYFCHKIRPELARTIERDFHTFCRDCHTKMRDAGFKSGPVRRCAQCHGEALWTAGLPP